MSVVNITKTTGGVKVVEGSKIRYINGKVESIKIDGSIVTVQTALGKYPFSVDDTITIDGAAFSGTAEQLADKFTDEVFFLTSSSNLTKKIGLWEPVGNGTTITTLGFAAVTQGTATARFVANTNFFTRRRRVGYVSAATAATTIGWRQGFNQHLVADGFHFITRFGFAAIAATHRAFVGFSTNSGFHADGNPSALFNLFGIYFDSGDTNWKVIFQDADGSAEITNLGANFPVNTTNTDFYEFELICKAGGPVRYKLTRLNTGHKASGSSSLLPDATSLISPQLWYNNGTTAAAIGIDISKILVLTDY